MYNDRYKKSLDIIRSGEQLINNSSSRYRITVQVANLAKRRRYEDFENIDDPMMKPVIRAIREMSDELTESELIKDWDESEITTPHLSSSPPSYRLSSPHTTSLLPSASSISQPSSLLASSQLQTQSSVPSVAKENNQRNVPLESNPCLKELKKTANLSSWNNLDQWLAESWADIDFEAAEESVIRLQRRNPGKFPYDIAHTLIVHKSLQAAGVELIGDITNKINDLLDKIFEGLVEISLPSICKLSAEMVYQIAAIYGFPLNFEERLMEAQIVFAVTCLGEQAINAGINWLMYDYVTTKVLKASTKALMIYAIGNVACILYELKAKERLNVLKSAEALKELETQSHDYLEDATSEEAIRHKIAKEIQTVFPAINYSKLRDLLTKKQWQKADMETGDIVLELLRRNFVDDMQTIPNHDIHIMDDLWVQNSKEHFGFSVQRQIYISGDRKVGNFGETVGWRGEEGLFGGIFGWKRYEKLNFNLDKSPKGHLPAFWLKIYEGKQGGVIVDTTLKEIFERKDW